MTFHWAENKKDPERPFAFLATHATGFGAGGKLEHPPLGRALELGADAMRELDVQVALGGLPLWPEELERLLSGDDGPLFVEGQWVELDRDELQARPPPPARRCPTTSSATSSASTSTRSASRAGRRAGPSSPP